MTAFSLLPTPVSGSPFWTSSSQGEYGPLSFAPMWTYQPPKSSTEVGLWSAVHLRSLSATRHLVRKILCPGWEHKHLFRDGRYIVALRRAFVPEIGWVLNRGAWACPETGAYGENLVQLYGYLNNRAYSDSILVLAREAKLEVASDLDSADKVGNWCQEKNPLNPDLGATYLPPYYPLGSELQLYFNASGHVILQAIQWSWDNGERVRVYRSMWRHRRSAERHWAEILPQSPLPLFNAHLLRLCPETPVALVEDEFLASKLSAENVNFLFSTIPGGLKNFPTADLEPLRGHSVRVVMGRDDLERGYRIEYALRQAGVEDPWFSVGLTGVPRPFEALEATAAELGMTLLPSPTDATSPSGSPVVIAAGEPIPGGDEVRRMLLDPIIGEGYLVWLYAEPQIGKTWLGLAMAYAVATGNSIVGRWRTIDPVGVLYVDGEMLPNELEESISMVMAGAGDMSGLRPFAVICAQCQTDGVVDITSQEWQETIEQKLKGGKLLFLDNVQSLTDNGQAAFEQMRRWVRKLTQKGVAVVVFDHTNREGKLQGSIAKERVANLVIALSYPDERAKKEGRILVEYTKARRLHGADAEPFQLQKIFTESTFALREVKPSPGDPGNVRPQVLKMALVTFAREEEGLSYPKIEEKYKIAVSTAHGYYMQANTLIGDEKIAFDKERRRLTSERERLSAAHSDEIGR